MRNSGITFTEQLMAMHKNYLSVMNGLTKILSSQDDYVTIEIADTSGKVSTARYKSVGFLESELERLRNTVNTLSGVDQRGAIIQPSKNEFKRIIVSDLNREPAPISELSAVNLFITENNHFFDSLLNPLLKVRLDLSGKVEQNVRRVLSRRYIINFEKDESGIITPNGRTAVDLFNERFRNRTNIQTTELEAWLMNTPGIQTGKNGNKLTFDEQEVELEANRLQYEGLFTILGVDEDVINHKMWYLMDTLNYTEIDTNSKQTLKVGDELILNLPVSTTRYAVAEINTEAADIKVRFRQIEGLEPMPVSVVGGMKIYSPLVNNQKVDISIGFNEYNVVFVKPINTDNNIISRKWSSGVAYFTNDLKLFSDANTGENGKSMTDYYINTVSDFGELLKDAVTRQIPRSLGIKPDAPKLAAQNFRVIQVNKHLTATVDLDKNRKRNENINNLRSKQDEINKTIEEKRKEQYSRIFRKDNDRVSLDNEITNLVKQSETIAQSIGTEVSSILSSSQNDTTASAKFHLQGFWDFPLPKQNGNTREQYAIGFRVEFKYASKDGQENTNETFVVLNPDGTKTNASFSQWINFHTLIRERIYDLATQKWVWAEEDLADVDKPNVNTIAVSIQPNEKVSVRVKAVSEVGYPDSILESDWSETLEYIFPDSLLNGRNPQDTFTKNAELEALKTSILAELNRRNIGQHLNDSAVHQGVYYTHSSETILHKNSDGKLVSAAEKFKQLESSEVNSASFELPLVGSWKNQGGEFENAHYFRHESKIYLSGIVRIDNDGETETAARFPDVEITQSKNSNYYTLGILPDGFRPDKRHAFTVVTTDNANARVDVLPSGEILVESGKSGFISLCGILFRTK